MAEMRTCIGSKRFGIEAHEAAVEDFPSQPSQKDGLGRMCKSHWNQYTAGLARDAKARKAAVVSEPADDTVSATEGPAIPTRSQRPAGPTRERRQAMEPKPKPKPEPIRTKAPRPVRAPKVVPAAARQGDAG